MSVPGVIPDPPAAAEPEPFPQAVPPRRGFGDGLPPEEFDRDDPIFDPQRDVPPGMSVEAARAQFYRELAARHRPRFARLGPWEKQLIARLGGDETRFHERREHLADTLFGDQRHAIGLLWIERLVAAEYHDDVCQAQVLENAAASPPVKSPELLKLAARTAQYRLAALRALMQFERDRAKHLLAVRKHEFHVHCHAQREIRAEERERARGGGAAASPSGRAPRPSDIDPPDPPGRPSVIEEEAAASDRYFRDIAAALAPLDKDLADFTAAMQTRVTPGPGGATLTEFSLDPAQLAAQRGSAAKSSAPYPSARRSKSAAPTASRAAPSPAPAAAPPAFDRDFNPHPGRPVPTLADLRAQANAILSMMGVKDPSQLAGASVPTPIAMIAALASPPTKSPSPVPTPSTAAQPRAP